MQTMGFVTAGLVLMLVVGGVPSVWSQQTNKPLEGAMIAPVMRSAMWAYLGNADYAKKLWRAVNYDYFNRLNCGGKRTTEADYEQKCGPCGDAADSNRPNEHGGKYSIGEVVAQYHEGHQINVSVDIRSINKGGTFRFSLCVTDKTTKVSHSCFRQHVLRWQNTGITNLPVPRQIGLATYTLQLPAGVTCENCVIQWLWRDGTSTCDPPGSNNCGQQTVTNCADVQILNSGVPFTVDFDKPRYDAYSSIFDPMDTNGDDHGIGIHVPRSSLDPAVTIKPGVTNPSPNPLPGGSVPIIIPGGNPSTTPKPDTSLPGITIIPGGGSPANSTTGDNGDPPDVAEKLVDPIGVVVPAVVGTTNVLSGNTGIGVALLIFALYMFLSQQPLAQGNAGFGTSAPPEFLHSPLSYQSYLNPATPFHQPILSPSSAVYNSGAVPYPQTIGGGVIQGQSGLAGVSGPYSPNSNVASGLFSTPTSPFAQTGFTSPGTTVLQQPVVGMTTVPFSTGMTVGNFEPVIPGNINTGVTPFQTPFTNSGVSTGLSSNTVFTSQSLRGDRFVPAGPSIPFTGNSFSASPQFPQGNNGFAVIPQHQSLVTGNTQLQGSLQTQTPFQLRPDVVMPQFDQEPFTVRERETNSNQGQVAKKENSCECHAHVFLLTAYCHVLSTKECREDDGCFCNEDKHQRPFRFNRKERLMSSINNKQGQKLMSQTHMRRRPAMQYRKQN